MKQENCTTKKQFSQLKYADRQIIEKMYHKISAEEIALLLNKHRTTVQRDIKLGLVTIKKTVPDEIAMVACQKRKTKDVVVYSADVAYQKRLINATAKGANDKLGKNHAFANKIAEYIKLKYSPAVALEMMRRNYPEIFVDISIKTLYNYIENGMIYGITSETLWEKRKRKKREYKKTTRLDYRNVCGKSIDKRPQEANERSEFGHWEIDLVVGKQGSKTVLLTLTERKTRYEIILKLRNRKQKTIAKALDGIERSYGSKFKKVFKSITADNGSEFINSAMLEKSCIGRKRRTIIYYAHPYSSWERGSNEVGNKFIRRFVKKGLDIANFTHQSISKIAAFINNYLRKILNWKSSKEEYDEELIRIGI